VERNEVSLIEGDEDRVTLDGGLKDRRIVEAQQARLLRRLAHAAGGAELAGEVLVRQVLVKKERCHGRGS
jgi:hypothetical protein